MARFSGTMQALLALSSLAYGQSSTSVPADGLTTAAGPATASVGTATIDGTPTTYSVAFTVPADADTGPSLLPNIYDSDAVQAQTVCPGYKASNVQKTANGMTASLSLAGDPVRVFSAMQRPSVADMSPRSATFMARTSRSSRSP